MKEIVMLTIVTIVAFFVTLVDYAVPILDQTATQVYASVESESFEDQYASLESRNLSDTSEQVCIDVGDDTSNMNDWLGFAVVVAYLIKRLSVFFDWGSDDDKEKLEEKLDELIDFVRSVKKEE